MTTLPTNLVGTILPTDNRAYHNTLHAALAEFGLPTGLTGGEANHPEHHEALQEYFWSQGVAFDVVGDVTLGHTAAHNRLHLLCNILTRNYGPDPAYTQPAGSQSVNPGAFNQALVDAAATGTKFWLTATSGGRHELASSIALKTSQEVHMAPGAKITGAKILSGWTASGADWFVTGQTQRFTQGTAPAATGFTNVNKAENLWFDGEYFEQVDTQAALASGKFFFDYATSRIYVRDDPAGHVVETTNIDKAFTGSASGQKFQNMTLEKFGTPTEQFAIDVPAPQVINCDLAWCHGYAIHFNGAILIQGSRLHHNGMGATGGQGGGTLEDSQVDHNNVAGIDPGYEAVMKWAFAAGTTLRRSWFHHNRGNGPWFDICNSADVIEDNLVEDNLMIGIFMEITGSSTLRRNICRRNGQGPDTIWAWDRAGINLVDSSGADVYNNSCYDNGGPAASGGSILGYIDTRVDATGTPCDYDHINNDIHENLMHDHGGYAGFNDAGGLSGGSGQYYTAKNNRYRLNTHRKPSGNLFHWWTGVATSAISFATWQAQGQDTAGTHDVLTPAFDYPGGFADSFGDGLNQMPWDSRYWRRTGTANTQVQRLQGRILGPAGTPFGAQFITARTKPAANAEVVALLRRADGDTTGGSIRLWLRADTTTGLPANAYMVELTGTDLFLYKRVAGSPSFLATVATGLTLGTAYWVRFKASGTSVQAAGGTSPPGSFTTTVTDSSVSAAGRLAVSVENASGGTAVDARVDQVTYTLT